jgi:hypothetical protein
MKTLELPILERSRKFGYIYWQKKSDGAVDVFFKKQPRVFVTFCGTDLGEKQVDYKNRRISIGWRWTRQLPHSVSNFSLKRKGPQDIDVTCT